MLFHGPAARGAGTDTSGEEVPRFFLPDGKALKPFTLGQATVISDLYWLKEIQYIGTEVAQRAHWPQLYQLGDLVVELDPEHGYAYEVTGLLLSQARRFEESNDIFEKGRRAVPQRWQLPFFEAFNEFYELHHYQKAAELLTTAARLPGAPLYASRLAAKLFTAAGRLDTASAFIDTMLQAENLPDQTRKDLETQRFGLRIERDLELMERAVAEYQKRTGHPAQKLEDVVGVVLTQLPVPPAASEWIYDPATGEVTSSLQDDRLRYHPLPTGDAQAGDLEIK